MQSTLAFPREVDQQSPPLQNVLSIGYAGMPFDKFTRVLWHHDVKCVADCRWQPFGRGPFGRPNLEPALKAEGFLYQWIKAFGNPLYRTKAIRVDDVETGTDQLLHVVKEHGRTALLCVCREFRKCHVSHVAEHLKGVGVTVARLG